MHPWLAINSCSLAQTLSTENVDLICKPVLMFCFDLVCFRWLWHAKVCFGLLWAVLGCFSLIWVVLKCLGFFGLLWAVLGCLGCFGLF